MKVYSILFFLFTVHCSLFTVCYAQEIAKGEEDLFSLAQEAFQKGNYKLSLNYLERLLENSKDCSFRDALLYWMGECHFKENEFGKAKDYYFQIIKDFPNSQYLNYSLYSLGWCQFYESNFKEALLTFQKFLEKFPQDKLVEDASLKIIECLYNLKSYSKLKEKIDLHLSKFPETKRRDFLLLYRAEALFYLDKYLEAIEDYERLDTSESRLKDLAQLGKGFTYLKLNESSKAKDSFSQLIEKSKDQDLILQAHYGLGLSFLKEKRFSEAKEEFFKITSNSPNYLQSLYLRGLCLYNLGEFEEAISIFENILKNSKSNEELESEIEFYISNCLFRIGKKDEALSRFKNLRIKYPNSKIVAEVLYWLGEYYYKEREFELAKRYFNAIISDFSKSQISPHSFYYLGKISLEEEDYLQAKNLFLKAIEENRDLEILILPEMALIYRNLGEFELALSSLKKLRELSKSNKDYWQFQIAELLQEQNRYDEAVSEYSKVSLNSPYGTKALLRIAKIYEDEDKMEEAESLYRKISNLDIQEAKFAQERLELITQMSTDKIHR